MQTLTIDQKIETVEFWLDDEQVKVRSRPPFEAKILFQHPPREQVLVVRALDAKGRFLGDDRWVVNRLDPPFRLRISAIEKNDDSANVKVHLSVPRKATIERLEIYYRDLYHESAAPEIAETYGIRLEQITDYPLGGAG